MPDEYTELQVRMVKFLAHKGQVMPRLLPDIDFYIINKCIKNIKSIPTALGWSTAVHRAFKFRNGIIILHDEGISMAECDLTSRYFVQSVRNLQTFHKMEWNKIEHRLQFIK